MRHLRLRHTLVAALALGCAGKAPSDTAVDEGPADTGDTGGDSGVPAGLNGVPPSEPVPLPSFTARNQLGEARTEADLVGHPTVLWFYPAAGTFG